nr:hypothetical protein [Asaccharospora irregularis]
MRKKFETIELDSSKSGSIEKIADTNIFNAFIGILKSMEACIAANIPIVQWVLPRIYPP